MFSAGLSLPLNIRLWGCENKVRNTGEFDFSVIGITTVRGLAIKGDCLLIQTRKTWKFGSYIIYICVCSSALMIEQRRYKYKSVQYPPLVAQIKENIYTWCDYCMPVSGAQPSLWEPLPLNYCFIVSRHHRSGSSLSPLACTCILDACDNNRLSLSFIHLE